MALVLKDFRSQVFRSPTQGKSSIFDDLGKPKVSEFKIPIWANQYIFRLQISVDDVLGVQVLENEDDLSCIKAKSIAMYAALWGSNMPSSRRWVKSSPPGTYSMNM